MELLVLTGLPGNLPRTNCFRSTLCPRQSGSTDKCSQAYKLCQQTIRVTTQPAVTHIGQSRHTTPGFTACVTLACSRVGTGTGTTLTPCLTDAVSRSGCYVTQSQAALQPFRPTHMQPYFHPPSPTPRTGSINRQPQRKDACNSLSLSPMLPGKHSTVQHTQQAVPPRSQRLSGNLLTPFVRCIHHLQHTQAAAKP